MVNICQKATSFIQTHKSKIIEGSILTGAVGLSYLAGGLPILFAAVGGYIGYKKWDGQLSQNKKIEPATAPASAVPAPPKAASVEAAASVVLAKSAPMVVPIEQPQSSKAPVNAQTIPLEESPLGQPAITSSSSLPLVPESDEKSPVLQPKKPELLRIHSSAKLAPPSTPVTIKWANNSCFLSSAMWGFFLNEPAVLRELVASIDRRLIDPELIEGIFISDLGNCLEGKQDEELQRTSLEMLNKILAGPCIDGNDLKQILKSLQTLEKNLSRLPISQKQLTALKDFEKILNENTTLTKDALKQLKPAFGEFLGDRSFISFLARSQQKALEDLETFLNQSTPSKAWLQNALRSLEKGIFPEGMSQQKTSELLSLLELYKLIDECQFPGELVKGDRMNDMRWMIQRINPIYPDMGSRMGDPADAITILGKLIFENSSHHHAVKENGSMLIPFGRSGIDSLPELLLVTSISSGTKEEKLKKGSTEYELTSVIEHAAQHYTAKVKVGSECYHCDDKKGIQSISSLGTGTIFIYRKSSMVPS